MKRCNLCDKSYEKLIKAHILPKCFYGEIIKDQKDPAFIITKERSPKKRPIGEYDDSILCQECDKKLGIYDEYAYNILSENRSNNTIEVIGNNNQGYISKQEIACDINRLLLFAISFLWRCHLSNREPFTSIDLGIYSDIAKECIIKNHCNSFGFELILEKFHNKPKDMVILPFKDKLNLPGISYNGYAFSFLSFKGYIKVGKNPLCAPLDEVSINFKKSAKINLFVNDFKNSRTRAAMKHTLSNTNGLFQKNILKQQALKL